jgi:hypothetical protein
MSLGYYLRKIKGVDWLKEVEATMHVQTNVLGTVVNKIESSMAAKCTVHHFTHRNMHRQNPLPCYQHIYQPIPMQFLWIR